MTEWRRWVHVVTRLGLAAFCWLTATYAFVTSSAFAYLQFVRPRVFPWVGQFSDWHPALLAVWTLLLAAAVWPDVRGPDSVGSAKPRAPAGQLAIALLIACSVASVWTIVRPVLSGLSDGSRSVAIGILALLPLIWLAAIDSVHAIPYLRSQRLPADEAELRAFEGRLLVSALVASIFLTVLYAALASIALIGAFEPDLLLAGLARGLGTSFVDHLLIFAAAFLVVALLVRVTSRSFALQSAVLAVAFVLLLSTAFADLVGGALSLHGVTGALAAIATAASIVGTWTGLRLRTLQSENVRLDSALDLYFGNAGSTNAGSKRTRPTYGIRFAAIAALAYGLVLLSNRVDWDFVLLQSGVLIVWLCAFGVIYRVTSWHQNISSWIIAATSIAPLVASVATEAAPNRGALDRYAVYNPSFRVADGLLREPRSANPAFDRYLQANTGLTDVPVAPVSIDFVSDLEPSTAPRTPMFLFVIDSLRPDYLTPYNARVRFTPRLAEFAADSVVFTNAFTRYGGTGLSVPAMWAGSSIVHKQYVQPFHQMNALEKLLDANGYRKFLSLDSIMEQLLVRSNAIDELDKGRATMNYEFCHTLEELDSKLAAAGASVPVFAYSLPQDIHMSRLPRTTEAGAEYQSFYAPYATKVHALDRCFGSFVDALKRRGLYDQSLIVITADHGEMLGEDGRFGHSYHLFPQVVQIPLIVHLPAMLARVTSTDADAVSLTTDITPTMYAALGYRPVRANDLMGRPLVGADDQTSTERRRETYVIAASYGAVYAVLRHNGRRLFIADAVKGGDQAYERDGSGQWHQVDVAEGLRAVNQFAIRQHVDEIARMYHLTR